MTEFCFSCKGEFECGLLANKTCWCLKFPALAKIDKSQPSCLCPPCLSERLKEFRCFRAWVSYDGSDFCGFQEQLGQETIQSALKTAIAKICRSEFRLNVAGRTDAGVHAKAQVISIEMATSLDLGKLVLALSHTLPKSIRVFRVDEMPKAFDPKRHAVGKRYVYRIWNALASDPFHDRYMWHVRRKIDSYAMSEAAKSFIGELDFESFRSAQCGASHARRSIWAISVMREGYEIAIDIRGNAFCQNMVRIIAGTLIEVGIGKRSASQMRNILEARDRTKAGMTAPAKGLTLERVYYPDEMDDAQIPEGTQFPRYPVTEQSWPFRNDEITIGPTYIR